jgi:hypothetical protein
MGLLLFDAHHFQDVENRLAFYFKLSGQIVDSNLHPLRIFLQYSCYAIIMTSRFLT